ncbi:Exonuclease 3'-5' domain-containing protein 2 [Saguinus oedipus]|uniref:Exonuclease 3'-5' domain-containing protein 2 n=1 Tax=Saguinus oedipus TaxID=9490 RepID=A0ABQ9V4V6_SAGOE|nr:Exonuclease 3'-5' domain-containing protein 2 [Saguinus oedipus]
MASPSGLCVLIRLPKLICGGKTLPRTLLDILADGTILKVGVGCSEDASKLLQDYGLVVRGCLDLRYLAMWQRCEYSEVFAFKDTFFCGKQPANRYVDCWVIYAARDAQISVALFLHLLGYPFSRNSPGEKKDDHSGWRKVLEKCQGVVDIPFRSKGMSRLGEEVNGEATESQQKPRNKKSKMDGMLVSEEPFVVKLRFEPAGRPESPGDYYLMVKENLCVVCGKRDSYIRKNVIPHEYRKHFPIEMKDHNSHDVLLLCTSCHAISNYYDNHLKQQLAKEFQAPIGSEEGLRLLEDPERRQVRSGARALLNAESLPAHRKEELLQALREFYNTDVVTEEMLQEAASLETRYNT